LYLNLYFNGKKLPHKRSDTACHTVIFQVRHQQLTEFAKNVKFIHLNDTTVAPTSTVSVISTVSVKLDI